MRKSVLEQFFDGRVYPKENITCDNPKYRAALENRAELKKDFYKRLSDDDTLTFDNLETLSYEMESYFNYECFAYGFRIGIAFLLEALDFKLN